MLREFELNCPECQGWILIDLDTGEVLRHGKQKESRKKKVDPKKFDQAMDRLKQRQDTGEETFSDAVRGVERQQEKLDEAFEQAKRRARENPDERPTNPFDDLFA